MGRSTVMLWIIAVKFHSQWQIIQFSITIFDFPLRGTQIQHLDRSSVFRRKASEIDQKTILFWKEGSQSIIAMPDGRGYNLRIQPSQPQSVNWLILFLGFFHHTDRYLLIN